MIVILLEFRAGDWSEIAGALVFIHDPKYFCPTPNPLAISKIHLEVGPNLFMFKLIYLQVTKIRMMSTAERPCNTAGDYNFYACMKSFVANVCLSVSITVCYNVYVMSYCSDYWSYF